MVQVERESLAAQLQRHVAAHTREASEQREREAALLSDCKAKADEASRTLVGVWVGAAPVCCRSAAAAPVGAAWGSLGFHAHTRPGPPARRLAVCR